MGAVAVGGALWYLSQDPEAVSFDPKKHTVEELRKVAHALFVEGATLYCQKVNQMRQAKVAGDFTE